jgi:hypothetical protein
LGFVNITKPLELANFLTKNLTRGMSCKFFEVRYIKLRVFELQKEFKKSYENSERVK